MKVGMRSKTVLFLLLPFIAFSCVFAAEETVGIKEGEFAASFVSALGIGEELGEDAGAADYATLLEHYGIVPLEGWNLERPLTFGRLAILLARAKNIKPANTNNTQECFNNIADINKEWFRRFQEEKQWVPLQDILAGKPKCPFGIEYEDKDSDHLIDRHSHPEIEKTEEEYAALLAKDMPVLNVSFRETVSRAQVKDVLLTGFSGRIAALRSYLTPATPILPKDIAVVKPLEGDLVFAVYDNGSAEGRRVTWSPTWLEGSPLEVTVIYANDGSLPGGRSIIMLINGIEVSSATGQWDPGSTPDKNIWIGTQPQTEKFPADAVLSNFKVFNNIQAEAVVSETAVPSFISKLNSPVSVMSPEGGSGGQLSETSSAKAEEAFQGTGFLARYNGQYILFPIENMNHLKGSFKINLSPNFASSDTEHAFLGSVNWSANGGADGFYLYYQPEHKIR
jgi:hypothetical protein